jgi:hypothetical protein
MIRDLLKPSSSNQQLNLEGEMNALCDRVPLAPLKLRQTHVHRRRQEAKDDATCISYLRIYEIMSLPEALYTRSEPGFNTNIVAHPL